MPHAVRTGYVLEVYPRLSETFVVTEILAREAHGEQISIFALRPPTDPGFHPELSHVRAPVRYLPRAAGSRALPEALDAARAADPGLASAIEAHLPDLLQVDTDDAVQAVLVARAARGQGVTHLHAHFASTPTTVTRLASLMSGIPYSFTAHAVDLFHSSVSHADLDRKFRDAAFAVTVSDYNLAFLRRILAHADRTHRVYNGLDLGRFPFTTRSPRVGDAHLLAVGRLVEKKGFALLIEAVRRLRDRGARVQLDIVGAGELEGDLAGRIARSGHPSAIRLLGALPQDAVAARLREADVFVAPCVVAADGNADGLPTVLLEAMASGVPCISTDVTGIPEVVRSGQTGLLCRPGDVDALMSAIETAIAPGFDGGAMARRARALVEREFDATRQAAVLAELTARARPPG